MTVSLVDKIGWTHRFKRRYNIIVKTVSTSIFDKCKSSTGWHGNHGVRGSKRSTPAKRVSCKHYKNLARVERLSSELAPF